MSRFPKNKLEGGRVGGGNLEFVQLVTISGRKKCFKRGGPRQGLPQQGLTGQAQGRNGVKSDGGGLAMNSLMVKVSHDQEEIWNEMWSRVSKKTRAWLPVTQTWKCYAERRRRCGQGRGIRTHVYAYASLIRILKSWRPWSVSEFFD